MPRPAVPHADTVSAKRIGAGAAPSIVWASGALFAAAFVILVPVAIWIYTLVFAFSSLWFAHYCLAALEKLRAEEAAVPIAPPVAEPLALPDGATRSRSCS